MNEKEYTTVITDIDNTLFDWFEFWYNSFESMLTKIEEISGIPRKDLLPEIKEIPPSECWQLCTSSEL